MTIASQILQPIGIVSIAVAVLISSPAPAEIAQPAPAPDKLFGSCDFVGGMCGFVGADGEIKIPPRFDWVDAFADGRAIVRKADKFGAIDKHGRIVVPLKYSLIDRFANGRAAVLLGDRVGIIDSDGGPVVPIRFGAVIEVTPELFLACDPPYELAGREKSPHITIHFGPSISSHCRRRLWGLWQKDGTWLVPPRYATFRLDRKGRPWVQDEHGGDWRLLTRDVPEADGVIDRNRPFVALETRVSEGEGLRAAKSEDKQAGTVKWGFRDKTGQFVIPPRFDHVSRFTTGIAWAAFPERRQWCKIDKRGNIVNEQSCVCGQPIVIYEWPHDIPNIGDCYANGLADLPSAPLP